MENAIRDEFKDGKIWKHDIEYANLLVSDYVRFIGGDEVVAENILDSIHNGELPLDKWDGEKIIRLVEDYIDR